MSVEFGSFIEHWLKGDVDIAENRLVAKVDDALWDKVVEMLAGVGGGIATVSDLAFINPRDMVRCLNELEFAFEKSRVSVLYEMCRSECGTSSEHQGCPDRSGEGFERNGGEGFGCDRRGGKQFYDSMFALMPAVEYDNLISCFTAVYGTVDPMELPSREQISAVKTQVQEGCIPYADLAIFQPHQRRRLRSAKQEPWVLNELGVPTQVSTSKVPNWEEWKSAFKTFRLCLTMLGVATQAEMERYQSMIESLALTYRENWAEVYLADDAMRAMYLGRYKPEGPQATWGQAFTIAACDSNYWTANVDRVVTRIRLEKEKNKRVPDEGQGRGAKGKGRRVTDIRDQICYAYQNGSCSDKVCPNKRKHLILQPNVEVDDAVNDMYLGGLRSAYESSRFLPRDTVREALSKLGGDYCTLFTPSVIEKAREILAEECNIDYREVSWTMANSPLRGRLVQGLAVECDDWDLEAVRWINGDGAPIGADLPIVSCGVFPRTGEEKVDVAEAGKKVRFARSSDMMVNYPSAEDNPEATMKLFEEERKEGFCRFFDSFEALSQELNGEPFVVSKVALAEKGPDSEGMMRYRMIVDGSESGVNSILHTPEAVQLPRVSDVVDGWKEMVEGSGEKCNGMFVVIDFRAAFKLIPIARQELKWGVCYFNRTFILYDSLQFGYRSSPLVWGREAALLARMGQLVLSPDGTEGRINTYVDDPLISVYVKGDVRRRQVSCLPLLLWEALGAPFSIRKGKLEKVREMMERIGDKQVTRVSALRSLCGRLTWMSQVAKQMAPFVAPMWAAWAIRWLQKVIMDFISDARDGDGRYLVRRFPLKANGRNPCIRIMVVDACWSGIGGVLVENNHPKEWFADIISDLDVQYLGIDRSKDISHYQNAFELLAILVGSRLWSNQWADDVPVLVRSDSVVAISSAVKMKSKSAVINRIAMELAYDGARSSKVLDMKFQHIAGASNCWADALSRLQLGAAFPKELEKIPGRVCPVRDSGFWKLNALRAVSYLKKAGFGSRS
ncbi:hypothetical protein FOL47_007962 [Perkinsus chesapeaki]|uniref:Uncharacterized protein n=1 Tax=Perkinsus chesapeaki TaxID=330153 RepID=A0A7J6LGW2_PERCH|nr:hypothetical protein FOL47_007962 [Perkinsus chesapeaki]